MALAYCFSGQQEKAWRPCRLILNIFQLMNFILCNSIRNLWSALENYEQGNWIIWKKLSTKSINDLSDSLFLVYLGIAYYENRERKASPWHFWDELGCQKKPEPHSCSPCLLCVQQYLCPWMKKTRLFRCCKKLIQIMKWNGLAKGRSTFPAITRRSKGSKIYWRKIGFESDPGITKWVWKKLVVVFSFKCIFKISISYFQNDWS